MARKILLLLLAALGAESLLWAVATADARRPPVARRRFLAAEEGRPPVFIWDGEQVELVCRPANGAGCQWVSHSIQSHECTLVTGNEGQYRCMQGEVTLGFIRLKHTRSDYAYETPTSHTYGSRYFWNLGENPLESYRICSDTGKTISVNLLCDGHEICDNGEDEVGCFQSCDAPTVLEHSQVNPAGTLYPHGASVTYTCLEGFLFRETLGQFRRTCSSGQWSGRPPICWPNAAFGKEVTVEGAALLGLGPELAVDGRTDTWAMLAPSTDSQSLTVKLDTNASAHSVLVWTSNNQFEAFLGPDGSNACTCGAAAQIAGAGSTTNHQPVSGIYECDCPGLSLGPAQITVKREQGSSAPFSVAEIAVLEELTFDVDDCVRLDRPAHGLFEPRGDLGVELTCEPGHRASRSGVVSCDQASLARCVPISCAPPPLVSNAVVSFSNGTGWSSVTQYECAAGHRLFPTDQATESVCGDDGLWSISHVMCLPETDIRVVTVLLGEQHARSVGELRAQLERLTTGQEKLLRQLAHLQRRLRRLEDNAGLVEDSAGLVEDHPASEELIPKTALDMMEEVGDETRASGNDGENWLQVTQTEQLLED